MGWVHLANTSDFGPSSVIGRVSGARSIAIYHVDGKYYVTSDICTHANGVLSQGEVVDGYIECPLHFGLFEIPTGKAQGAPVTRDLVTFPVKVEGTQILVDVPDRS
jgi:nitrite reductase/ring-hydroxylating ferredoxin subunit